MLEKTKRLQGLYNYFHPDGQIIQGGMLDEVCFENSKGKVMYLLKEVNDPDCKYDWTLPGLLRSIQNKNQTFYRTWKNVSRWTLATEYSDLNYQEIESNSQLLFDGLSLFATTNLKKVAGIGTSNYEDIEKEAIKNRDEWLEEISIIKPHLIICGGTYNIVKKALDIKNEDCNICGSGAEYFTHFGTAFLDFVHPAYQVSDKLMFAYFKETYYCLRKEYLIPEGIVK